MAKMSDVDAAADRATGVFTPKGPTQPRPYQNVPDSLMGFSRNGPGKSYEEQKYKHVQPVRVHWEDGMSHEDSIKGLNKHHAVERAYRNWAGASHVEPIDKEG